MFIFKKIIKTFRDDHAFSLLHWASKEGHISIVDMLLARGARVNSTNMGDDTSLHLAAAHGHRQIVVVSLNFYKNKKKFFRNYYQNAQKLMFQMSME